MTDIVAFNRRSVQATVAVVEQITTADLDLPTPCSEWTVRDLLEHHIVQNHGFAFAATGERSELSLWQPKPLGGDHVAEYAASAEAVNQAFAVPGVTEVGFWLPEFSSRVSFKGQQAIGFHFIDCVVHAWDLARAVGADPRIDEDLAEACLPIARAVPDAPETRGPGKAFHAGLAADDDAPALDRVLAMLGRSPSWSPAR
ncbi:TIGR03086 family metal-binding protein [Nonomuraea soli]|uniref:Uncharacterized protein (TIGR03086 family) n=1 Tax=Nonomuraea soli TaxID=1032476 RepID=A0A7W0CLN3_9ACTN|nr:TIGR03086 family metal-binding protein [Nonomuraea soli]MBA2893448.1 uncharacterized protein (TIGR03086 family) [Nonomuraea soli]